MGAGASVEDFAGGEVTLTIKGATDLVGKDGGMFSKATSDPFGAIVAERGPFFIVTASAGDEMAGAQSICARNATQKSDVLQTRIFSSFSFFYKLNSKCKKQFQQMYTT